MIKRGMKRWGVIIVNVCLLLTIFQPSISTAETEVPEVIINELAWAGSSVSSSDEWIELYNITDQPIDLAGWTLKKVDTSNGGLKNMLTIPANHAIGPNDYFVIANYRAIDSVLATEPDYQSSSVELHNTQLQVQLINADGTVIDTAWDGITKPISSDPKSTLERNPETADGAVTTNWHASTKIASTYFDFGTPDQGSPFEENSPKPPDPIPAPTIVRIDPEPPNQVIAGSDWTIESIIGEHFATEGTIQIKLAKTNPDLAIWTTDFTVVSDTTINSVKFKIPDDTEAGEWDLVVINPGQPDHPAVLYDAVTITEIEEEPEIPVYSDKISLSELYPHPTTGQEEFIELYNAGDNSVNLKGWKLDDQLSGGSAVYAITADTIITPHQYLIFPKSQTHLYLNDTGDYARLLQPNDTLVDSVNYGTATTGYSYSKINSNWQWSKRVTPNAANIYESTAEEEDEDNETDQDPASLQPNEVTIQLEADDIAANSAMLIWKINLPGAIGDIKIYQSNKKGLLGTEIGKTSPNKKEYLVKDLSAKIKYFFTLVGTYNADDIKSNQIEITTADGKTVAHKGTSGVPKQIIISEIMPNPNAGDNEFIEIYNPTDQEIDISGWKLLDASGKTYVINALDLEEMIIAGEDEEDSEEGLRIILEPGQYLLLEYPITRIRLNNSGGEEVQLLDPDDNLIDEISYAGSVKQGYAYVLAPNEQWFWSNEITPGEANDISFAGIIDDSGAYLVDSGKLLRWPALAWLCVLISAIIWNYRKRYGYPNLHHQ